MNIGPKTRHAGNGQITLLLYCCDNIKSHRSEVDTDTVTDSKTCKYCTILKSTKVVRCGDKNIHNKLLYKTFLPRYTFKLL